MKIFSALFGAHYQQTTNSLAMYWRVQRQDAQVFGWIDHDQSIAIDSVLYRASEGLQVSMVQNTDGFAVPTMDVTAFLAVSTEAEIEAGIWEESVVTMFEARWDSPPATFDVVELNVLRHGVLGRVERQNLKFMAEIRGLSSRLDTRIGRVVTPTCPWRHAIWNGSTFVPEAVCNANLTGKIHTGTITSVGANSRMVFSASGLAPVAGYFNDGILAMTSGPNAGLGKLSSMDVRRWENQQFSLHRPLPYVVSIGETFTAVIGDDKTFGTCRQVFSNPGNFGGAPYLPGMDSVLENPLLKILEPPRPAKPDNNPNYSYGMRDEGEGAGDGE